MARRGGNPNLAAARAARTGRSGNIFIRIDDNHAVITDKFNISLVKIYENKSGVVLHGLKHYGSFTSMTNCLKELDFNQDIIETFQEKTKDVKTHYEDGFLKIELPDDFVKEEYPFAS